MKKFLSFFAAALVAIAVNADPIAPGANALSAAISEAEAGATIELAAGNFTQSGSITIDKNITIQAADMKNKPLLEEGGSIYISNGANVKFVGINIKADGSHDAFDISNGGTFELDGCEVYDMAGRRAIKVGGSAHVDALKINNCYFHGGTNYPIIEVEQNADQNGCNLAEIKNSTFANFTLGDRALIALNSKNSAKAADPAEDVDIIVDHCTFYNINKSNEASTYGCIDLRKSTKASVSNCIFANPTEIPEGHYAHRATQLYGGSVSNCLIFNTPNHRSDDITITNPLRDVDPLFVDAANGNFALGEGSPAIGAATDGSNLGDPRWAEENKPEIMTTFKFTNNFNWEKGYLYAWDENGHALVGEWPGSEITGRDVNQYEQELFIVEVPVGAVGVVISDGNGAQTVDITDFSYDGYWMDGSQDGEGHYYVNSYNDEETAIRNAAVEAKTVKMMENGQLVIIKNGVKYNVLGTAL